MFYIAIPLLVVIMLVSMWGTGLKEEQLKYSDFLHKIETNEIVSFDMNIANRSIEYSTKDGKAKQTYKLPNSELFISDFNKIVHENM